MSLLEGRKTLLLIGVGNMGEAMLRSWVKSQVNGLSFIVLEPRPSDWLTNLSKKGLVELNPRKIIKQIVKYPITKSNRFRNSRVCAPIVL